MRTELFAGSAERQFGISKDCCSSGYVSHRDRPGLLQTMTHRLADHVPDADLDGLKERTAGCGAEEEVRP